MKYILSFIILNVNQIILAQDNFIGIKLSDLNSQNATRIDTLNNSKRITNSKDINYSMFFQEDLNNNNFVRYGISYFTRTSSIVDFRKINTDSIYNSNEKNFNKYGANFSLGKKLTYQKFDFYCGANFGIYKLNLTKSINELKKFENGVYTQYNATEIKGFMRYYELHSGLFISLNYNLNRKISIGSELSQSIYFNYSKDNTTVLSTSKDIINNVNITSSNSNSNYTTYSIIGDNLNISFLIRYHFSLKGKTTKLKKENLNNDLFQN